MNQPPSDFILFLGRFHPVLVHLPVAFIILLGLLELRPLVSRLGNAEPFKRLVLWLAVPASALSVLCGWLLSQSDGYDEGLVSWHKWTGLAVAVVCLVALGLHIASQPKTYRLLILGLVALMMFASHNGGSLTHGSDYLTRYAPGPLRGLLGGKSVASRTTPAAGGTVFVSAVKPILDENCVGCHGPEKSKADLRLDSLEAMLKGGEKGPALQPGQSGASELVKRLLLPVSHEDRMPPEGKPQPSSDDIALLRWWIDAGAPADKTAAELNPPENIRRLLSASAPKTGAVATTPAKPAAASTPPKPLSEVLRVAEKLADEFNIAITALSPTEPWLQCNASLATTNFGDAELARLAPLALNLRWLDLARTRVTETGLVQVAAMKNLLRLHLEQTSLGDAALTHLGGLANLEYLNLYATPVTAAGLAQLKPLTKLRQLYLWQTKVPSTAALAFAEARVNKEQARQWQAEIEALRTKLKSQGMVVDIGAPVVATKEPAAKPINTNCPVSGKPVDLAQTVLYEGKLVAFCCEKCKASFEKDAKPYLSKLDLSLAKPINTKCPISDKDIDPTKTSVHAGKLVAFCCDKCKAQFDKNPQACLAKLGLQPAAPESKQEEKP